MLLILYMAALSLLNMIRGGLWLKWGNEGVMTLGVFGLLSATFYMYPETNPWGDNHYTLAAIVAILLFVFEKFGWGRYFGAMKDPISKFQSKDDYQEVEFIDWVIEGLIPEKHTHSKKEYTRLTRLWGFSGMTLRGCLWLFPSAIALLSLWPMVVGGLMGVVYYFSRSFKHHWKVAEGTFGALIGAGLYLALFT